MVGIYMGYVVLLGLIVVLLDKQRCCPCSRGSLSRLLPFAAAMGVGNSIECFWVTAGAAEILGGIIFSLCGLWPLKAIYSMPRTPLRCHDAVPLGLSLAAFGAFFGVFYSLCDITQVACAPYKAPIEAVVAGYIVGAAVGVKLGCLETGHEEEEELDLPPTQPIPEWAMPRREVEGVPGVTIDGLPRGRRDSFGDIVGDAESCSVCLNAFAMETVVVQLPKCKHIFCPACVKEWLLDHTECPLCKTPVLDADALREERRAAGVQEPAYATRHVLFADPIGEAPPEPTRGLGMGQVAIHVGASEGVVSANDVSTAEDSEDSISASISEEHHEQTTSGVERELEPAAPQVTRGPQP